MKKSALYLLMTFVISFAHATTLTVTNTNDVGLGSLRDQIGLAASGDTIQFDVSLIGDTIILTSSQITFNKDLVILGLGPDSLAISGNYSNRIFNITGGNVTISKVKLKNGYGSGGNGGAIIHENNGNLNLNNVHFENDRSISGTSGAVHYFVTGGVFKSDSCLFINCAAGSYAGALRVEGCDTSIVNYCLFDGNEVWGAGEAGAYYSTAMYCYITNSSIINNKASFYSGGVEVSPIELYVSNCTFSHNFTLSPGLAEGCLWVRGFGILETVVIINSTFSGNNEPILIQEFFSPVSVTIQNNIFNNTGLNYDDTSPSVTTVSNGGNISNDWIIALVGPNDFRNTNPKIDTNLTDNGGFMSTHSLLAASPALNNGITLGAPIADQIGNFRSGLPESGSLECIPPNAPILSTILSTICLGDSISVQIGGNLNSASKWTIYTNSCNTGLLDSTASSSFVVFPIVTTTYYIRGEGNCVNSGFCDSITITVGQPTAGNDTRSECDSLLWIDGNTYTSNNNTATFNLEGGNANGCDSLVTLDLTIVTASSGTDARIECDSLTWLDGNTYSTNNNTTTFNIVGGAFSGCDSLVTLDLIINNSATGTDTRTECSGYVWLDGNAYSTNNNNATFNITGGAANGCDSLITLDLTINTVDTSLTIIADTLTANATGATYQWFQCDSGFVQIAGATNQQYIAPTNGDYSVVVTQNGCSEMSACVTILGVGINKNSLFNNVSIYPNPNQGMVNITLGNLQDVSIKVYSMTGQVVYQAININNSTHHFELNEAKGIYFLEIESQGERKQVKLIKQ